MPLPWKLSEHNFCIKKIKRCILFKPVVDPRGFKKRNPNLSWTWLAIQKAVVILAPKSCAVSDSGRQGHKPRGHCREMWLLFFRAPKDARLSYSKPPALGSLASAPQMVTGEWPVHKLTPNSSSFCSIHWINSRTFFEHVNAHVLLFITPNTCYIRKLSLLQALK